MKPVLALVMLAILASGCFETPSGTVAERYPIRERAAPVPETPITPPAPPPTPPPAAPVVHPEPPPAPEPFFNTPPQASLSYNSTSLAGGVAVDFHLTASDVDADELSWWLDVDGDLDWDQYGKGRSATVQTEYNHVGTFTVTLVVSDGLDETEATAQVHVTMETLLPLQVERATLAGGFDGCAEHVRERGDIVIDTHLIGSPLTLGFTAVPATWGRTFDLRVNATPLATVDDPDPNDTVPIPTLVGPPVQPIHIVVVFYNDRGTFLAGTWGEVTLDGAPFSAIVPALSHKTYVGACGGYSLDLEYRVESDAWCRPNPGPCQLWTLSPVP